MKIQFTRTSLLAIVLIAVALITACGESSSTPPSPTSTTHEAGNIPLVQKTEVADWCREHGVPESVCTRCNAKIIPQFRAKGDWCKEHELPESQCVACHPDLEAKLKAMAPKSGG